MPDPNSPFPLLASLPCDVMDRLLGLMEHVDVAEGEAIIRQGEDGDDLFLIESGHARVEVHDNAGRLYRMGFLNPGDHFGEIALLSGRRRTADVTALSPMVLKRLNSQAYFDCLGGSATVQRQLGRTLVERIARSDQLNRAGGTLEPALNLVLDRLVEHELDALRSGATPSFEEVVAFYWSTRFLYPAKLAALGSRFDAIAATWERLIAANGRFFKILVRKGIEGSQLLAKNSICAFEYAPGTWQAQHLIGIDRQEYTGTLPTLMALTHWLRTSARAAHVRLTYRPNNMGTNLLFGGLARRLPADTAHLAVLDHLVLPIGNLPTATLPVPPCSLVRVDASTAGQVKRFYLEMCNPVVVASLALDDPDLAGLASKFRDGGLLRTRAIFAAVDSGKVVGAVICNLASEGMNFSFLENAIEELRITQHLPSKLAEGVAGSLLAAAFRYYLERGRKFVVALLHPEYADVRRRLGLAGSAERQYAQLTFEGGSLDTAERFFADDYRERLIRLTTSMAS